VTSPDALVRNYRAALLGAVSRRSEVTLHRGYELGRDALADGVSVLELARVHHECLVELLRDTVGDDVPTVAVAASEFFLEVLATVDMTQRAFLESHGAAAEDPAGIGGRDPGRAGARGQPREPRAVSSARR
jgi:hypothetical protein